MRFQQLFNPQPLSSLTTNFYHQVYAVVRRVPAGRVTSYGRVARMLGRPRAARAVGYALNALKDSDDQPELANVPWWRVVNRVGNISTTNRELSANRQLTLLRSEGIVVSDAHQILDFKQVLWDGLPLVELDMIIGHSAE